MSLQHTAAQIAKDIVIKKLRKKILGFVLAKVLPIVLIILFIYLMPYYVSSQIKADFGTWYQGKESAFPNTDAAVYHWVDTLEDEAPLGDGFVKKEQIKSFITEQESTYLHDVDLNITETVDTSISDTRPGSGREKTSTEKNKIPYVLKLSQPTYDYRFPWQAMLIISMATYKEHTQEAKDIILSSFSSKFYGLLGNSGKEVLQKDIKDNANFQYRKKVKITTTEVNNYNVEETETVGSWEEVPVEDDSDSSSGTKTKKVYVEKEVTVTRTYTRTTVTHSYSEYPLPYFSRIEALSSIVTMDYEDKVTSTTDVVTSADGMTTTTVVTDITEPVLKNYRTMNNATKFVAGMRKLNVDVGRDDVEFMQQQAELLPNGAFARNIFGTISRIVNSGFDMYSGVEAGTGKMKLSGTGVLSWPSSGPVNVTSGFGMRFHPVLQIYRMHEGIDIACDTSMQVLAAADGVVDFAGTADGYGNLLILRHNSGISTRYAHLSEMKVVVGQSVKRGQVIAVPGNTGTSTGVHLHFETLQEGAPVDPAIMLGLVPDVPEIRFTELKYREIDRNKLMSYLSQKNSYFVTSPRYVDAIIQAGKSRDLNPLLLFSITGAEMSFVVNDYQYWENVYAGFLLKNVQNISPSARIDQAPQYIANNPFNVYHSWWEYNTTIEESARVAANTVANSLADCPPGRNPIMWVNMRDGSMGYAEDTSWWQNVSRILTEMINYGL